MINLEYNLKLNQEGGTEAEQKQAILGIGMSSTDYRFIRFIYINNDRPLSLNDIEQIKVVYNSNPDDSIRWRYEMEDSTKWNFQLLKIRNNSYLQGSEKIIGVAGINLEDREFGYDAIFHSDEEKTGGDTGDYIGFLGKGYYRQLCAERVKNVKRYHPTKSFFLFTQHTHLLKTHIDSGLELLDVMPPAGDGTFTCRYSSITYTRINGSDYALRLLCNDHKPDNGDANKFPNFVLLKRPTGPCSGLYIGNGIIITAAHCYKTDGNESGPDIVDTTVIIDQYNTRKQVEGKYHYLTERTLNSTWKDISVIVINKNDIADMQLAKIPILDDPVNIPPLHHMDSTKIPELFMYGYAGGGVRNVILSTEALNPEIDGPVQSIIMGSKRHNYYDIGIFPTGISADKAINEYKKRFTCTNYQTSAVQGDSGGPLYFKKKNNKFLISSVIGNMGSICPSTYRDGQSYGIAFFNTSFFKNWINTKIEGTGKGTEFLFYSWRLQKTKFYDNIESVPVPVSVPINVDYIRFLSDLYGDDLLEKINKYKTIISKKIKSLETELHFIYTRLQETNLSDSDSKELYYRKMNKVKEISTLYATSNSMRIIENFYIDFRYNNIRNITKIDLVKTIIKCNI